ncbi:MAG TPA: hypothetical protein VHC90_01930 [Bryobacteraceae bacterium]|nr:hypothetical protein [Bryobacteraceae bacterium]
MAATLTNVAPLTANPGDQIILTGTGFLAGAIVTFVGGGQSLTDPNAVVNSATEIAATVPDFGGDAMTLAVTVQNNVDGEDATAAINFSLKQYPPVEAIYPLCGLSSVKRALSLEPNEHALDDALRNLILIASSQIAHEVTVDLKPVTLTNELYDGDGTSELVLRRGPVASVAAVRIDGVTVDMSEVKVYDDRIAFDDSDGEWNPRIQAVNRIFPCGRQNVAVDYVAGFATVPADLFDACIHEVTFLRNLESKQGLVSDANQQTSATTQYSQLPIAPYVQRVCNRYRHTKVSVI